MEAKPSSSKAHTFKVVHDGVDANHPDPDVRRLFVNKKNVVNQVTRYKNSADRTASMLKDKGFKNVRVQTVGEEATGIPFKQFRSELIEKTLTPAEKKKREEVAKAIERENPNMPMGMKMAIATKTAKRVAEANSPGYMLKADPELAKKFKEKEELHKAKVKAMGNPAAGKSVKEDAETVAEEVKTTHEDPLVVVHKNGSLWTHANLSVANKIHGTKIKAKDVHAGKVKVGNLTYSISKHHASEVTNG